MVEVETVVVEEAPLDVAEQSLILVAGAMLLVLLFCLFALASDWGSARKDSKSCCYSKKPSSSSVYAGGDHFGGATPGATQVVAPEGSVLSRRGGGGAVAGVVAAGGTAGVSGVLADRNAGSTVVGVNGEGCAGAGSPPPPLLLRAPAVLTWSNLSYRVAVNARSRNDGCGGGGVFGFLANSCRSPELSVLSRVSGFAGPMESFDAPAATYPYPYPAATVTSSFVAGKRSLSVSSGLSTAAGAATEGNAGRSNSISTTGNQTAAAAAAERAGQKSLATVAAGKMEATAVTTERTTPSTITGILGPSGAGKSSLLDILAGRKRSGEGRAVGHITLTVDGRNVGAGGGSRRRRGSGSGGGAAPRDIRRVAGYVPQEDVLPGTLSCYEHLMFHARLRMPRRATHAERRARALLVLAELGLGRVADSRVGDARRRGLSGGEKRRLSIAAELIARPPLLFLDEPTTGLGRTWCGMR